MAKKAESSAKKPASSIKTPKSLSKKPVGSIKTAKSSTKKPLGSIKKLKSSVKDEVLALVQLATHARLTRKFRKSKELFQKALSILPPPAHQWETALTVYLNFGETLFIQKKYDEAAEPFGEATKCPNGLGYPRLHLRLGQIRYEQGHLDKAKDELMRAYMGDGEDVFEREDPKYFNLIKGVLAVARIRGDPVTSPGGTGF